MWDKLSMAEKAAYIRVGVQNGITSLNDIKKAYNTYADGGTMLPEVVVTPRMNYINYTGEETNAPTLEQYKQARRDETRANALLDMQNTTEPTVPSLPSPLGRIFKRIVGDWYDDKDVKFIFGTDKNPNTCLSTVTSKYGRTISGNKTFRDNYRNYGFIEVPEGERDHGDIVQTIGRRGVPSHAAMVSGFTKDGKMLIDQSRGGVTSETIKHDVDYYDTKPELKKKKYYRFVGNKADNSLWEKEYKEKYNKYDDGGPKPNKVNYYNPITGQNYGDTMPEGMSRVRRFEDLTPQAQDEYMANRSTQLDDLVVYPRSGKGAKSTNMGSYYDTMNTLTEQNRKHAEEVAMQDALVRETSAFEKPLNFLSPGQYFGAAVDYFQGESPFWEGVYNGNSGWVSDSFAEKYPKISTLANTALDKAFDYVPTLSIKAINKSPNLVAKLRHPTYKKYYHGTSADFNIKDARMGSTTNLGLHASGTPKIAEDMKMHNVGTNPHVKEFYAPKPSAESIDTWNNGIEQLSTDYEIKHLNQDFGPRGYDAAGNNKKLFNLIKDAGGEPYMVEGTSSPKYNVKNDVTLNLREQVYPKVKDPKVDQLIKEFRSILQNNKVLSRSFLPIEEQARLTKINAEAAKILSDNGYKVVKYNNVSPLEGGGGSSYIITDPSVIYQHTPFTEYGLPPLTLIRKQQNSASSKK